MDTFDLVILGGGASAFGAAIEANDLGARTAMIDHGLPLGGTCVNVGCVPSKTLLWAGELLHMASHHGIPGVEVTVRRFDVDAGRAVRVQLFRFHDPAPDSGTGNDSAPIGVQHIVHARQPRAGEENHRCVLPFEPSRSPSQPPRHSSPRLLPASVARSAR